MKTNKLPQSVWTDSQAAGSQSQQTCHSNTYCLNSDKKEQTGSASNDATYSEEYLHYLLERSPSKDICFAYKRFDNRLTETQEYTITKDANIKNDDIRKNEDTRYPSLDNGYKKMNKAVDIAPARTQRPDKPIDKLQDDFKQDNAGKYGFEQGSCKKNNTKNKDNPVSMITTSTPKIPERLFMNGLIKHTAIALTIIIPLAAFSAYAAPQMAPIGATTHTATTNKTTTATLAIMPSAIIHKSASTPTTVDSVDLAQYAGTWYEIGRLPMYFQRNCARDVTATYTEKTDGSGITVLNQCIGEDGKAINAEGLAKTADNTGSKLKVTFLPSWIRWLPVGRADYWVLARDADYQTALVGTPDHKYLWLLARSPNITQQTYAKYREIAQQQGYDLKEFKLTTQTNQTVNLVP